MPELMSWAAVAVASCGITCWELVFLQVPLIMIVLADNQWGNANGLDQASLVRLLGWWKQLSEEKLAMELTSLIMDVQQRSQMSHNARQLVDGKGVDRVLAIMAQ